MISTGVAWANRPTWQPEAPSRAAIIEADRHYRAFNCTGCLWTLELVGPVQGPERG